MDNAMSFKEIFMSFIGMGYVVNHRSREIHNISEKHRNCHIELIADQNKEYVSKGRAIQLIKKSGYNGCRWCWNPMDNG
jgi:hypothetical protein